MNTKNIVVTLILAIVLVSCSNSSELKFLDKNLSVSCEEFEKHLEKNGFKHEGGHTYKGDFLGEKVDIILDKEKNGHYTHLTLMFVSVDIRKAKRYYDKVCEEIGKEHKGFKERNKEKDDNISYTQESTGKDVSIPTNNRVTEYYNGNGKAISISCYSAAILATVLATFESDD